MCRIVGRNLKPVSQQSTVFTGLEALHEITNWLNRSDWYSFSRVLFPKEGSSAPEMRLSSTETHTDEKGEEEETSNKHLNDWFSSFKVNVTTPARMCAGGVLPALLSR